MNKGIICAGTLVVDLIKVVDIYPKEGMLGNIISEHMNGGGAVFNVMTDLAEMNNKIPLFAAGLLGRDDFGKYLRKELTMSGVKCTNISLTSKELTAYTDVIISQNNGSRTFFHRKGSNALLDLKHFAKINIEAKIFHLGYLMILDKLDSPDETFGTRAAKLLSILRDKGYIISVDLVTINNKNYESIISHSLPFIDYLIINELEAERASGISTREKKVISECGLTKAALKLLRKGVNKAVIIHYPEGGFALSKQGEKIIIPSYKIEKDKLKSSVGAGDAFCSGMLYSIHENIDLKTSLKIANASAWFNLQNETSTGGAVTIKKIMEKII